MALPKVAIIGRPNVGKSTLFNRLTRTRHALVADVPGVTRDRREGKADIGGLECIVFDTAGLEEAEETTLQARMTAQTFAALADAQVILLVVDARSGILPIDRHFAQAVRASCKPVILVINKAEGRRGADLSADAYTLGFDTLVGISAEHGDGIGDLLDALIAALDVGEEEERVKKKRKKRTQKLIPMEDIPEEDRTVPIGITVVGRPNVGKSTFLNRLLGQDRLLTGPEAGITRDAITVDFDYKGQALRLVDTAGMRKKSRVVPNRLEVMAVNDTRRAIQFAQVAVLMLDATQALEKQDLQIAGMLAEEGRACVLALNKWDLVPHDEKQALMNEVLFQIDKIMPMFKGISVVPVSASQGKQIDKVIDACLEAFKVWNSRISTGALNRWLEDALSRHTPPQVSGRRLKIKFMTQAKTRPPTFAVFVNVKEGIPESYQRYLINALRETFHLPGVPIRLLVRRGKNPYEEK